MKRSKEKTIKLLIIFAIYCGQASADSSGHGAGNIVSGGGQQQQQQQQQQESREITCTDQTMSVNVEEAVFSTGGQGVYYRQGTACIDTPKMRCEPDQHIEGLKWTSLDPREQERNYFALVCQPNSGQKIWPQVQQQQQQQQQDQSGYWTLPDQPLPHHAQKQLIQQQQCMQTGGYACSFVNKIGQIERFSLFGFDFGPYPSSTQIRFMFDGEVYETKPENDISLPLVVACGDTAYQSNIHLFLNEVIRLNHGEALLICK